MKKLLSIIILLLLTINLAYASELPQNDTRLPAKQILNEKLVAEDLAQKSMMSGFFAPVDNLSQSMINNTTNQTPLENLVDPIRWEPYFVASILFLILGMLLERKLHWIGFFSGIIALTFFVLTNTIITGTVLIMLIVFIIILIITNGILISSPNRKGK